MICTKDVLQTHQGICFYQYFIQLLPFLHAHAFKTLGLSVLLAVEQIICMSFCFSRVAVHLLRQGRPSTRSVTKDRPYIQGGASATHGRPSWSTLTRCGAGQLYPAEWIRASFLFFAQLPVKETSPCNIAKTYAHSNTIVTAESRQTTTTPVATSVPHMCV